MLFSTMSRWSKHKLWLSWSDHLFHTGTANIFCHTGLWYIKYTAHTLPYQGPSTAWDRTSIELRSIKTISQMSNKVKSSVKDGIKQRNNNKSINAGLFIRNRRVCGASVIYFQFWLKWAAEHIRTTVDNRTVAAAAATAVVIKRFPSLLLMMNDELIINKHNNGQPLPYQEKPLVHSARCHTMIYCQGSPSTFGVFFSLTQCQ